MQKRLRKHKTFLTKYKKISRKLVAGYLCPLGSYAIDGFRTAEHDFEKLPIKWKMRIGKVVDQALNDYHKPDEHGYSGYDMDRAMMGY